jgi:hypothetical protein
MMSNRLIIESRRNEVITMFLNLCTLYCRMNNFLLMLVVRKLSEEEKEFMIARLFDVVFSRSISRSVDITSLFDFSDD